MKVYLTPPKHMSRAMFRVANALTRYAPRYVQIVSNVRDADLQLLHVIGEDAITYESAAPKIAVIQYCTNKIAVQSWYPLWKRAQLVWSYYDFTKDMEHIGANFYHAPLGIDEAFLHEPLDAMRTIGVVTSGYVAGPGAEAIEEVAKAADALGKQTVHIGPMPVGLQSLLPKSWINAHDISDEQLANIYGAAQWVSGLRHIEGFELPVIEGLVCGARPIVFDRPEMRQWFDGHAVFVPECSGYPLVNILVNILNQPEQTVSPEEQRHVMDKFDWQMIAEGFWNRL